MLEKNKNQIIILLTLLFSGICSTAHAEQFEAKFGGIVPVFIEANKARQVMFALPLDAIEFREDTGLTVKSVAGAKDMIVIDSALLLVPQDVFVTDIEGNRYHLRVEMTKTAQDAMLFVKDGRTDTTKYAEIVKQTPLSDLLSAMASDKRIEGYGTEDLKKPKRIYWRDGLAVYIHRIYSSGQWKGFVTTVENTNDHPVTFNVKQFDYHGLVAIGAEKSLLAPKPRLASEIRAGLYKTRMEFVIDTRTDPNQLRRIK